MILRDFICFYMILRVFSFFVFGWFTFLAQGVGLLTGGLGCALRYPGRLLCSAKLARFLYPGLRLAMVAVLGYALTG